MLYVGIGLVRVGSTLRQQDPRPYGFVSSRNLAKIVHSFRTFIRTSLLGFQNQVSIVVEYWPSSVRKRISAIRRGGTFAIQFLHTALPAHQVWIALIEGT